MTRAIRGLLGMLCCAVVLAACAGNDDSSSTTTHDMTSMSMTVPGSTSASGEIVISGNAFSVPASVRHGSVVTVRNDDKVEHSVTADDGTFNVEVEPGGTTSFTAPAVPAYYAFHCTYHPTMRGSLTVK